MQEIARKSPPKITYRLQLLRGLQGSQNPLGELSLRLNSKTCKSYRTRNRMHGKAQRAPTKLWSNFHRSYKKTGDPPAIQYALAALLIL